MIDPSLDIRIELISGTEGSLSFNSIIKSLKNKDWLSRRNLLTVATVEFIWFSHELKSWTFQSVLDYLTSRGDITHLSLEDIDAIAKKTVEMLEGHVAKNHVENIFRVVETDFAITGIGSSFLPGERPLFIIPRQDFQARTGTVPTIRGETERRTRISEEIVTLIRPVLLDSNDRKWGFKGREGEFGASVKDAQFIQNMIEGRIAIPLVSGITLAVTLHTSEERKDGVWHVTDRTIMAVHRVTPPQVQTDILSPTHNQLPKESTKRD